MRVILARSTAVIQYLEPHILVDEEVTTKERFLAQLQEMLSQEPERTFVITVFDDKQEEPPLIGFLVAYAPPGSSQCFISQAWSDPKAPPEMSGVCFLRLMHWARSKEMTSLLMETKRDPTAFQRRWGFTPKMVLMEKKISIEYETELVSKLQKQLEQKEVTDGQQRPEDGKHVDGSTEASGGNNGGPTEPEPDNGRGGDTLWGPDHPRADAAVPAVNEHAEPVLPAAVPDGAEGSTDPVGWEAVLSAKSGDDDELVSERRKGTSPLIISK